VPAGAGKPDGRGHHGGSAAHARDYWWLRFYQIDGLQEVEAVGWTRRSALPPARLLSASLVIYDAPSLAATVPPIVCSPAKYPTRQTYGRSRQSACAPRFDQRRRQPAAGGGTIRPDLVLGLRRGAVERGSMYWHQRPGNVFMSWVIRRLTGASVHDLASFKAIRGSVLRDLEIKDRRQGWTAELIIACAVRRLGISEVSTDYRRRTGKSKVSGSASGSLKAAYRLNAAILRVWLRAKIAGLRSADVGATVGTRRDK
jgi:hypothetical protein